MSHFGIGLFLDDG